MNDSAPTDAEQPTTGNDGPVALDSRITDVTVFRQDAQIRRRVVVAEGQRQLRIGGLPLALRDSSVRVHGEGLSAQEATVIFALAPADPALKAPKSEALEEAKRTVRLLEARLASVNTMIAHVTSLWVSPRSAEEGKPPGASPFKQRQELVAFRRAHLDAYQKDRVSIQDELQLATKERDHQENEKRRALEQTAAREHELRKAIDVSCNGKAGVLFVDYVVPGASWRPSYALRLDGEMAQAQLEMRAIIAQRTGEDWTDASVIVSTSSPLAQARLPTLRSIRIGRYQPPPQTRGYRPPPANTEALFRDYDLAVAQHSASPKRQVPLPRTQAAPSKPVPMVSAPPAPPVAAAPQALRSSFAPGSPAPMSAPTRGRAEPRRMRSKKKGKREQAKAVSASALLDLEEDSLDMFGGVADAPASSLATSLPLSPPTLEPGDDWLSFSDLHIPDADTGHRGRLRPFEGGPYVADGKFSRSRVQGQLQRAQSKAFALSSPPDGHRQPRSVDGFDFVFEVGTPVNLESSGQWLSVPLNRADASVRLGFVVVPRESRDVFRFVKIENPFDAPLLPGPLDVYLAGRFLLGRAMPTVGPKELLELGLGVEQRIKVARNTRYEESPAGLLRGSLDLEHAIEVEVVSHLENVAALEVRERVPFVVEENDDIEMRVHHTSPPWSPMVTGTDLRGGYCWSVRLKKGEKRILEAKYTVRISNKNELVGGNRRES